MSPLRVGAAIAAIGLGLFGAERCIAGDLWLGIGGLIASIPATFASGLWAIEEPRAADSQSSAAALALVAAVLVFFRAYRLNPPGLWGDDAINGLLALRVLDGEIASPFSLIRHAHSSFHALANFAIAASFDAFGASLTTLRLPGVIAGCIAGLGLYGIARRCFGVTTALIAALLFATSPMEIAHAKSLTQVVLGLMFQILGMYALVRADQERRAGWFAAAGVGLAATVYTYHSAKIAVLVAAPLVIDQLRRPETRRRSWIAAVAFAIALLPAVQSYWADRLALTGRAQSVSLSAEIAEAGSLMPLVEAVVRTLGIFHYAQGPKYHWFGPATDPALTLLSAALVLAGMAYSLTRWRSPYHQTLLVWFAVGIAPAALSSEAPRVYRALLASPPLFIWAAMPLARLWHAATHDRVGRVARATVVALLLAGAVFDYNYYFHRWYTHPYLRWNLGQRMVELASIARDAGDDWIGVVMTPTFSARYESLDLLSRFWNLDLRDAGSTRAALQLDPSITGGAIFLTAPGSETAVRALKRIFPSAEVRERFDPAPYMWWGGGSWPFAEIRPHPYPVTYGLAVAGTDPGWTRASRAHVHVRCVVGKDELEYREPLPFYHFFVDTFAKPASCVWTGDLIAPNNPPRSIDVETNLDPSITVDGQAYAGEELEPGRHSIRIESGKPQKRFRLRLFWKGPGSRRQPIPPSAWRRHRPRV